MHPVGWRAWRLGLAAVVVGAALLLLGPWGREGSPQPHDGGLRAELATATAVPAADPHLEALFGPLPAFEEGTQAVAAPFEGVRLVSRGTDAPRPLRYHVVQIDPAAEGIAFTVTPPNGDELPRHTTRQTAVEFVEETGVALAINAHFFRPWPPEDEYAELLGLSVSDGVAYAPFRSSVQVALVFDEAQQPAVVRWAENDATGYVTDPPVQVHNGVGAREQIVTQGANTAGREDLHPRTAAGVTARGHVVWFVADGRQAGSEGMSTPEVAEVLLTFGVVDAINLDGGGSTTLVVADPEPRVVNRPVGYRLPGTLRHNGSHLGVYARPRDPEP